MSLGDTERFLLNKVIEHFLKAGAFPEVQSFRLKHEQHRRLLDELMNQGFLRNDRAWGTNELTYRLTLKGLRACDSDHSRQVIKDSDALIPVLKNAYRTDPARSWLVSDIAQQIQKDVKSVQTALAFLVELPIWSSTEQDQRTGLVNSVRLAEPVLDVESMGWPLEETASQEVPTEQDKSKGTEPRLERIEITSRN